MSSTTTYYNLIKPALDDTVNIQDFNTNSDLIDAALYAVWEAIYPVGSIYMSAADVDPNTIFGGTWVKIENRFLLAAGSDYQLGATGGEESVTLTVNQIPSHSHVLQGKRLLYFQNAGSGVNQGGNWGSDEGTGYVNTTPVGGSAPHNNMPPYLAVNVWQRTV